MIVRLIKIAVFIVLLPVTATLGTLWLAQDRLIFPAPDVSRISQEIPDFSNISLATVDGENLSAYWRPPDGNRPSIIVFHGNGDAAVFQHAKGYALFGAGFGVLLAEYRGYGRSTGSPSEEGLHLDALAAYDFVDKQSGNPIGIYAHSLGTGVGIRLAQEREIFALVLESPFDSLQAVAEDKMPWVPMGLLLKHRFPSDERIGSITAPILIMHGNRDRVIPIEHGKRLASLAPEASRFIEIDGAGHNNLLQFETAQKATRFFLEALQTQ